MDGGRKSHPRSLRRGQSRRPDGSKGVGRSAEGPTVRISPEADRLRRELQAALNQPANKIVERALRALKAEVERHAESARLALSDAGGES